MGTWATNGSMLAQSTMASWPDVAGPAARAAAGGGAVRLDGSTPTTSQVPSIWASSISLALIRRPPTKLIRCRAFRSWASSSSPARRSNRRRSTRLALEADPARLEAGHLPHGDEQVTTGDGGHQAGQRRPFGTFIAGATSTGARVARYMVVRKSSAMPWANLARMLAVAGATTSASAHCASPICSMPFWPARPRRRRSPAHPTGW